MAYKSRLICLITLIAFLLSGFWYSTSKLEEYRNGKISRLHECNKPTDGLMLDASAEIVLIGDSRISEWEQFWPSEFPNMINRGIPGATTLETLCRNIQLSSIQNKIVVIQVGINDAVAISMMDDIQNQKEQEISSFNNIVKLVELFDSNNKVVLLTLVPPIETDIFRRFAWGKNVESIVEKLSLQLKSLASEKVQILDARNSFYDSQKQLLRSEFSRNALHWNHTGYRQLNSDLAELIN